MLKSVIVTGIAALSTALVAATPACAQEKFPSHPIELIVPTAPGGGTDIASRLLASIAESTLRQKILVVDKPGAGGAIGVETMLQAKPDAYTIAGVWNSPITITPQMFKVSYTMQSVVPIVLSDVSPIVFCVPKGFPASDGKQFIRVLHEHPNKYTYGTDGGSGTVHLAGARIFT
ncbi:MAG: Bug family tripartite tricarboxylate transporter substrate binding protein, partial [Bradyrhizobium sp.]